MPNSLTMKHINNLRVHPLSESVEVGFKNNNLTGKENDVRLEKRVRINSNLHKTRPLTSLSSINSKKSSILVKNHRNRFSKQSGVRKPVQEASNGNEGDGLQKLLSYVFQLSFEGCTLSFSTSKDKDKGRRKRNPSESSENRLLCKDSKSEEIKHQEPTKSNFKFTIGAVSLERCKARQQNQGKRKRRVKVPKISWDPSVKDASDTCKTTNASSRTSTECSKEKNY